MYKPFTSIALATVVLATPSWLQAQGSGVGLKGGVQMTTLHSQLLQNDLLPGGFAGVYFPISFGHRFELQPEVLVSMQGSTVAMGESSSSTLRMFYTHVPINVKFFATPTLNLLAGLQPGYLVSARELGDSDALDVTEEFKPIDVGINLGIGLGTPSGWDVSLRYTSGMIALLRDDNVLFPTNRAISLSVGHRFRKFGVLVRKRR